MISRLAQRLDHRQEVLLVPEVRDLVAVHVLAPLLHHAEAPRLDALGEPAEVPRVGGPDRARGRGRAARAR